MAGQHDSTTIPWRSRAFQCVLVSTLVLPLGVPLLSPLLPTFRDAFAITDQRASLLISAYFLPGIVLSPFVGTALDRVGRRPVLVVSLVAFGGVGVGMMALSEFSLVLAARIVQGIAAAGVFVTTVTIIADTFVGIQRNVVFGLNVAVLSTGRALYPVLGGALVRNGWNVPFVSYLAALLAGAFVYSKFEESGWMRRSEGQGSAQNPSLDGTPARSPARHGQPGRRTVAGLPLVDALLLYGATIGAETVAFGAILTTLPFLLAAEFGMTALAIGAVVAVTTMASAVVATGNGRLAGRASNSLLVASGFVLYGVSLVWMGMAPSPTAIAAVAAVFGGGIGLILPSVDARISEVVATDFQAGALGLRNSATALGRATGPLLFTGLAAVTGYRTVLFGAGLVALAGGLTAIVVIRR